MPFANHDPDVPPDVSGTRNRTTTFGKTRPCCVDNPGALYSTRADQRRFMKYPAPPASSEPPMRTASCWIPAGPQCQYQKKVLVGNTGDAVTNYRKISFCPLRARSRLTKVAALKVRGRSRVDDAVSERNPRSAGIREREMSWQCPANCE
jgi:hypothetical protein